MNRVCTLQKLQRRVKSCIRLAPILEPLHHTSHTADPISETFLISSGVSHKDFNLISQITMILPESCVPNQLFGRLVDKCLCKGERRLAGCVAVLRSPSAMYSYNLHLLWAYQRADLCLCFGSIVVGFDTARRRIFRHCIFLIRIKQLSHSKYVQSPLVILIRI